MNETPITTDAKRLLSRVIGNAMDRGAQQHATKGAITTGPSPLTAEEEALKEALEEAITAWGDDPYDG